jgi:hypothetical protein
MDKYADLEIGLRRREADVYGVDFRFSQPNSETDIRPSQGAARLDFKAINIHPPGSAEYGRALSEALFGDPAVNTALAQALASSQSLSLALRLRLLIDASAPELHSLHWEALRRPGGDTPLCTDQNLVFSRYLSSQDWRPVNLRPKSDLRALVVVANPLNLNEFQNLAPLDTDGEIGRARKALGEITTASLPDDKTPERRATLGNIIALLSEGGQDILYLHCHGALIKDEPYLWLEDDEGKAVVTPGKDLAARLRELPRRPQLVVLGSCQSAGHPSAGQALASLGPRLAEAGIPAVMAMQGNISLSTLEAMMPVFFTQLRKDGQIDRALAAARAAVQDRPDYWMPALFMRLKRGRVWYQPGFGEEGGSFELWPSILRAIQRGQVTPILGPGLFESEMGSQRDIARRWAEAYRYPMAPHERESLPQVAQFLTVNQYKRAPYEELDEYMRQDILKRFGDRLPAALRSPMTPLDDLFEAVGLMRRQREAAEPYKVLARLPFSVYITTNWNNLLASALREENKDPQVMLCPWNEYTEQLDPIEARLPGYQPSVAQPLVFHLFGRLSDPESVVLTEDDYFDYLIGVTRNNELIPSAVRRAITKSALLFLGFQLDDWQFRIIFRSIVAYQGGELLENYPHIAVQLEPEEDRILEPERARRYLDGAFKGANISLFWGKVEDFTRELHTRTQPQPA